LNGFDVNKAVFHIGAVIQFPVAVNGSGVQRLGGRIDGNAGARQQECRRQ